METQSPLQIAPRGMEMTSRPSFDVPLANPLLQEEAPAPPRIAPMVGCCCSIVQTGSIGVVQWLGEYVGVQEPGCKCYCPPLTTVKSVSVALQQLVCSSDCKTKDNVTLTVSTAVQYRVDKNRIRTAVFEILNPKAQIQAVVDNVLRSTLPTMDLDDAYSSRDSMVRQIILSMQNSMAPYGYIIVNVLITDLRPDASVLAAMNEINAARRLRDAALDKGEAEKILKIKASEADAEAKHLSGVGLARMRKAIADGYKESMTSMTETGITTSEAMHMMIVTQYLDTLKEFAHSKSSIMIPHGPGAAMDIEAQVRQGFLAAKELTS